MKKKLISIITAAAIVCIALCAEILNLIDTGIDYKPAGDGIVSLYGETHGTAAYYEKELSEWGKFYGRGCRDLFVELPYYTAEYLNMWMKADNDEILNRIREDIRGTASDTDDYFDFFRKIKADCPETVLHGTDVGHQYDVTGARFLDELKAKGLEDSEEYRLASVCIEQGKEYRGKPATDPYREEKMVENFIDAFERIGCKEIMGIYGSYHVNMTNPELMSAKLRDRLGDIVECRNLAKMIKPGPFAGGVCITGIVFILMLIVPNIIWTKRQPEGYETFVKNENRVLSMLESIGEVGSVFLLIAFRDFDPFFVAGRNGVQISFLNIYLVLIFALMIVYEIYWIRYFKSSRTMRDFYSGIIGIPLAGAVIPCICLFLFAAYGRNSVMAAVAVIMSIGHIGIHCGHLKEL